MINSRQMVAWKYFHLKLNMCMWRHNWVLPGAFSPYCNASGTALYRNIKFWNKLVHCCSENFRVNIHGVGKSNKPITSAMILEVGVEAGQLNWQLWNPTSDTNLPKQNVVSGQVNNFIKMANPYDPLRNCTDIIWGPWGSWDLDYIDTLYSKGCIDTKGSCRQF